MILIFEKAIGIAKDLYMTIELTNSEIKTLWVMCMAELSDDSSMKELATKLTKALKESAGSSK